MPISAVAAPGQKLAGGPQDGLVAHPALALFERWLHPYGRVHYPPFDARFIPISFQSKPVSLVNKPSVLTWGLATRSAL